MLYVDYNFDLNDNIIIFDKELKLKGQTNQNEWGNLPAAWREGDMFKLVTGANGAVTLIKVKNETT
jgi:hypothetical protein